MATYYDIKGQKVQNLASDPDPVVEGQVWYNTTSDTAKVAGYNSAGSWATGGAMNTARRQVGGFGQSPSTAVVFCGQNPPALANTEEYSGSAWSNVTANPQVRVKPFGFGPLTAALGGGGESGPSSGTNSGEYNGSAWTASATIPLTMYDSTGIGPIAAGVVVHGPQSPDTAVLLYASPGTWTTGTSSPARIGSASAGGTATAAIFSAMVPGAVTTSYEYASGTWTAGGALNVARNRAASGAQAPQSQTLIFGGDDNSATEKVATELYDGTSWSNQPNMSTARRGLGGAGSTSTSALAFGGYTGSDTAVTEEFTGAGVSVKTITTS